MASSGLEFSTKGLQSVCPTGIDSFDDLIGGGFALTSVNIIEEDQFQMYSSMLVKAYLSSAIYAEQEIIIFSPTLSHGKCRFIRELPSFTRDDPLSSGNGVSPAKDFSKMKIAFRYSNIPSRFDENIEQKRFDFGEYIDANLLESMTIKFYDHSELIKILREKSLEQKSDKVCRIFIDQLGSPNSSIEINQLPRLMHQLKSLMRRLTKSVSIITMVTASIPQYDLIDDHSIRQKLYFESDSAIRFTTFSDDDESNPYRQDYVGLVQLLRLPQLNSLAPYNPNLITTDYGLKLHTTKRFLSIEPLALPPDLGETVNRFTSSSQATDKLHCTKQTDF
ncbi:Elongator subunit elp4 [Dermatophagoides farinae]|uniref:Elongator complex protein 4 n=1 Tax=Dermatophagoides farinae TaxID=6954 RepID=A0A922KSZ2_DERFA|nr:elongator complex protein 4-like [Dermatophagoides farinae]KAH7639778.1 elongator complex protein-like protein [Dermatophagoides farinae]KAH9491079.1 Elongator subunit elp4 [Dermatophagoides farinae]